MLVSPCKRGGLGRTTVDGGVPQSLYSLLFAIDSQSSIIKIMNNFTNELARKVTTLAALSTLGLLGLGAAAQASTVTVVDQLPAPGQYEFTGLCSDCQPANAERTPVRAVLTVTDSADYSGWHFSYSSVLVPDLQSLRITSYFGDTMLDGPSSMRILFETEPTAVPDNLSWTGVTSSTEWSFRTSLDGDLYFELGVPVNNADFGSRGNWVPLANQPVPEPGSLALVGLALAAGVAVRRRTTARG